MQQACALSKIPGSRGLAAGRRASKVEEIIREHSKQLGHVRLIDYNHRGPNDERQFDPHEAERYKERSTAERINARLKDEFGGVFVRVRGHSKIMAHLMFGMLAMTADQLMRFTT